MRREQAIPPLRSMHVRKYNLRIIVYGSLLYISRSLPAELGDLVQLQELMLNNNYLRNLPYELGKLFQLMVRDHASKSYHSLL